MKTVLLLAVAAFMMILQQLYAEDSIDLKPLYVVDELKIGERHYTIRFFERKEDFRVFVSHYRPNEGQRLESKNVDAWILTEGDSLSQISTWGRRW